jgi:hypothetical protein
MEGPGMPQRDVDEGEVGRLEIDLEQEPDLQRDADEEEIRKRESETDE